jgi:hypothetical protein
MPDFAEPLYVGIDVDALLARLDHEDRHRGEMRRAGGRRSASQHSPLDLEARIALEGESRVALHSTLVA